jgi:hypothetical protein
MEHLKFDQSITFVALARTPIKGTTTGGFGVALMGT